MIVCTKCKFEKDDILFYSNYGRKLKIYFSCHHENHIYCQSNQLKNYDKGYYIDDSFLQLIFHESI